MSVYTYNFVQITQQLTALSLTSTNKLVHAHVQDQRLHLRYCARHSSALTACNEQTYW
jgi:hypothetical protein